MKIRQQTLRSIKTLRLACCAFIAALLLSFPALAAPTPKSKTEALKTYRDKLTTEQKLKEELEQKAEAQNLEIAKIKDSLIESAARLREHEETIRDHELEIQTLEARQQLIKTNLQQDRLSLSRLILALERLRRVPPEAMIARPDAPYETAQSALLMAEITANIQKEALALKDKLAELETIRTKMAERKEALLKESAKLQERHNETQKLVAEREEIFRKTHNDIAAREAEIQRLSLQSKNLEDLVARLEKERIKQEEKERERERKKLEAEQKLAALQTQTGVKPLPRLEPRKKQAPAPTGRITTAQLPISGIIRTRYQEKDDLGAISNGLSIEGRPGAMVLAPIDGKIQFAGAFKRYGNLIIIEHAKGYHSLVAGMGKINAVVGQSVSSGEPLGLLPEPAGSARPRLYYELRQNGQPVNPSVVFSELS